MAIYRQIYMTFWDDSKINETFTPEDRYFYLYLLTNGKTNICGCYDIGIKRIVTDTGYSQDTVLALLERMERVHNVIRYSPNTNEILLLNWHKYNWSKSPKVISAIKSCLQDVKNQDFKRYIEAVMDGKEDTVSIQYQYSMDTSVPVPVSVTDSVPVPDRLAEVKAYVKAKRYSIDPERFCKYYANKFPDDWKAQVDYWEATEYRKKSSKKKSFDFTITDPKTATKDTFGCGYLFDES